MRLRDYQQDIFNQVVNATTHDMVQLDTGAGKTPIEAALAAQAKRCIVLAHRNLLIAQISEKLAAAGVEHGIIGTEHTRRRCMIEHRRNGHRVHIIDNAKATVFAASVQSVIARYRHGDLLLSSSLEWLLIVDEAHHIVKDNMWGKLATIFPDSRFVGFTATPARADGRSLSAKKEGIFERLVQAESLKKDSVATLTDAGYLSPFRAWSIRSEIDESALRIGESGDYTAPSLVASLRRSQIVGDAVREYRRLADGKRAVAMCVSILNAEETAEEFRAAGIPAAHIASTMGSVEVARRVDLFRAREILVLCNVDMVGEGFDLPGIEALIMLRKTASFTAYRQWIGRALRPLRDKPYAIIIDHVGNVVEHGMPDDTVHWDINVPPQTRYHVPRCPCTECRELFEAWRKECPTCGAENLLLHRGPAIGGHYIKIEKLDRNLVEMARRLASEHEYALAREQTIFVPYEIQRWKDGGAVSVVCARLADKMIESVTQIATKAEINDFLEDCAVREQSWWVLRFTMKDLRGSDEKFIKAYQKWQKSRSSTQTAQRKAAKPT